MKFRKDLNGLRAIAVMGVVLFHFDATSMPGGFAGVDVFFVISGFLMTAIIVKRIENKSFSIWDFYIARANRIVPALSVVCLAMLVFGWFFMLDVVYETLSKHVISSLIFISNMIYWGESGYFDAGSHEKWALHTWSLSAEWQFYLLYPLVLLLIKRAFSIRVMKISIFIGSILGLILSVYATFKWPDAAYYLLPTRAWEMMVGGIAFLYPVAIKNKNKATLELVGLSIIIGSYFIISNKMPWPGFLALFPVLGAFLVIQANNTNSYITGNVIAQRLGDYSYSIYLWHWPLVVFMYSYMDANVINIALLMALMLILASVSYLSIEKNVSGKKTAVLWFVALILSVLVYSNSGNSDFRERSSDAGNEILNHYKNYQMDPSGLFEKCNASLQVLYKGFPRVDSECISEKSGGIFVWGDSHMGALSTGLRFEMPQGTPFSQLTSSNCAPSFSARLNGTNRFDIGCDFSNSIAYNAISIARPKVVLLGVASKHESVDWARIIAELKKLDVQKIIIIGPVPQWRPSLPLVYVQRHLGEEFISDPSFDNTILKSNQYLVDLSSEIKSFKFINILKSMCVSVETVSCRAAIDGELVVFDYGHLTIEGSRFIAKEYVVPFL